MRSTGSKRGIAIVQTHWDFPQKRPIAGQYVRLEPLTLDHTDALFLAAKTAPETFEYLRYGPFEDRAVLATLLEDLSTREDQPFWTVFDESGQAQGWLSICDVFQRDGAFEIGSIWFGPSLQGTRAAREAIFLLMCLGMDPHGYERLVWRCQSQNTTSFQAALNLGFRYEGTWRNAAIVNGWQRDIAWFSILKDEWPEVRDAFTRWLDPSNFDSEGKQHVRLLPKTSDEK